MTENPERYSEKQARDEAERMRGMVESGEASSYSEAEQKLGSKIEEELSPEIIEKVMEKVQDINLTGTAFHTIRVQPLEVKKGFTQALQEGILGRSGTMRRDMKIDDVKGAWATTMREKKDLPKVWFNIVGRIITLDQRIAWSFWLTPTWGPKPLNITFLFDLTKYTDAVGTKAEYEKKLTDLREQGSRDVEEDFVQQNMRKGAYWPSDGGGPKKKPIFSYFDSDDVLARGDTDYGFVLMGRVPPRHLKGVVLKYYQDWSPTQDEIQQEIDKRANLYRQMGREKPEETAQADIESESKNKYKQVTDLDILREKTHELARQMLEVDKNKPNLLLPIYDLYGNLLWPKQIPYDEVKELVSEREKKSFAAKSKVE